MLRLARIADPSRQRSFPFTMNRPLRVMVAAMLTAASHRTAGQAAKPAAIADAPLDTILVSGLPALIEYPRMLRHAFFEGGPPRCVTFAVRTLGSTQPTRLTLLTAGVSGALLSLGAGPCEERSNGVASLLLDSLGPTPVTVQLWIPEASFPHATAGATARVTLVRDGKRPLEATFLLQRREPGTIENVLRWIAAFLIPTVAGGLIALFFRSVQNRGDTQLQDAASFARFKVDNKAPLENFFRNVYPAIVKQDDQEYVRTLNSELDQVGISNALPPAARKTLMAALTKADRDAVARKLGKEFPENAEDIASISTGARS
jgi:hypothetical protein